VQKLRDLAGDVRAMIGDGATITYAADWSEYFGHQPTDGSSDIVFHLDPLWSDANIDVVGIDWYPPLTDWRAGGTHLDAEHGGGGHDPDYLERCIEAGEGFDWHYADDADRAAQLRTPITDGAYGEPWIYRPKDLRSFWSSLHYDRPSGVRSAAPTSWTPQAKPIWLIELGCPAVDKGANAPNLFIDPKSAESALPPFSSGARDDLIQRRTLEAYLRHWDSVEGDNPTSSITGRPMIEEMFLWCWDARPHPAFPARADVWADGGSWRLGHWLNGRGALSNLGEVVLDICTRAGVAGVDVSALLGAVSGFVVDAPSSARAALEPLMAAYGFTAAERQGRVVFFHTGDRAPALTLGELAGSSAASAFARRGDPAEAPQETRVRFLDAGRDYRVGSVSARQLDAAASGVETIDAPLVIDADMAEALAQELLLDRRAATETLHVETGLSRLGLEPGDRIAVEGASDVFRIMRTEDAETRRLELQRVRASPPPPLSVAEPAAPSQPAIAPTPALAVLDLPPLPGKEQDGRPMAAVFASPWLGAHHVHAGATLSRRAIAARASTMGELLSPLWPGPVDRWDDGNTVDVRIYGNALGSVTAEAALESANAFAIEAGGEWEIIQARNCVLVAPDTYRFSGLLRAQLGSAHAMRDPHPTGARVVKIDDSLARMDVGAHEWNEPLSVVAPPAGGLATDTRATSVTVSLPRAASRLWAPAHLRAKRGPAGEITITWVRTAAVDGDAWGPSEPPLGAPVEAYRLEILDGSIVRRVVETSAPAYAYSAADQVLDFGFAPISFRVRVAQVDAKGASGLNKELTITL
jgi:hypothetical protein